MALSVDCSGIAEKSIGVAFRVDASYDIATGHLMRCVTLADALKARGVQTRFVCRHLTGSLRNLLGLKNHELTLLSGSAEAQPMDDLPQSHLLGTSQRRDASDTLKVLGDRFWDWVIVDHYAIDARWESVMRKVAKKMMVIDDSADRVHDCDLLLDQNYYVNMDKRYIGKVPSSCQLLLGPRYALLRNEFYQARGHAKLRTGPVRRILVFLGGIDVANYTAIAIDALSQIDLTGIGVDVVIGAHHPQCAEIEAACSVQGFMCHVQTQHMAALMLSADIAIGAGGSASLERCITGLPSIVLVVADNQRNSTCDLDAAKLIINVGDASKIESGELARIIHQLINDESRRTNLSRASLDLMSNSSNMAVVDVLCGS